MPRCPGNESLLNKDRESDHGYQAAGARRKEARAQDKGVGKAGPQRKGA
jgi:hypothetical protein